MKFLRISSVIATVTLVVLTYIGISVLTYRFFLPWSVEEAATWMTEHPGRERNNQIDAVFAGIFWPVAWSIWLIVKVITNYFVATILSLFMLASYNPLMYAIVKINGSRENKKLRNEQNIREVDEYLKSYGIDLTEE